MCVINQLIESSCMPFVNLILPLSCPWSVASHLSFDGSVYILVELMCFFCFCLLFFYCDVILYGCGFSLCCCWCCLLSLTLLHACTWSTTHGGSPHPHPLIHFYWILALFSPSCAFLFLSAFSAVSTLQSWEITMPLPVSQYVFGEEVRAVRGRVRTNIHRVDWT